MSGLMTDGPAKFINNAYAPIRAYIKRNHGWSSEELVNAPEYAAYNEAMNEIRSFNGKRVKIQYSNKDDWFGSAGEKVGRVVVNEKQQIMFFEGRNRSRYNWLDAGLYDGWHAVLIAKSIEAA